jgi:hypothetical protein
MPGTNAGTGCPIAFACAVARREKAADELLRRQPRRHDVVLTGRERPARINRNARMDSVTREYRCSCGHVGWSRHIDLKLRALRPSAELQEAP